jgi:hypothetical protein
VKGIACVGKHATIVGTGTVNSTQTVEFRADLDDLGAGAGTDKFAIKWSGYSAAGTLTKGDIKILLK